MSCTYFLPTHNTYHPGGIASISKFEIMAPNPFDYFAIQNTIARYCIALDNKNLDLLADIFAPDVHAKFPVLGKEINDVVTLAQTIEKRSCVCHIFCVSNA